MDNTTQQPKERKRACILIADDDPALRRIVTRILTAKGHSVLEASDGAEALRMLSANAVDLIISDIQMPNLNGMQLLASVRQTNDDLPVILLAGAPSTDTAIVAVRNRATEYLPKPIEPEQLAHSVEHALQLNRLAQVRREALELYRKQTAASVDPAPLELNFQRALAALFMVYQPIVCWSRRVVFGYEALVRSSEPTLPHPGALFDAAEALDRLTDLGRQIRRKCGEPMASADLDTSLFVNLHTRDLVDDSLFDPASPLAQIAPRVILELTERAHLDKVDNVEHRIQRLRSLGFRIAIDDIGAGYSGLNSFTIVQPDIVKLDITLVRGVDTDPVKSRLVRLLLDLCEELGISVVAEGVETPQERDALIALGCDLFQGYLFARPAAPFAVPIF